MKKAIVLGGAGGMGSVAVEDLVVNSPFEEIVIADANVKEAKEIAKRLADKRISVEQIDITNKGQLYELLKDATVVLNFIGPFYKFGPKVIQVAIETKTHYVDICDDFDAAEAILEMNDEVEQAGITVLTGMGASPGITNILAKMGMQTLDTTEEIDTIWVMGAAETGTAVLYHVFHGGSGTVPGFKNGEKTMIKPFDQSGELQVQFPEPLGEVTVYDIGHPEPVTIPHFYPNLKRVTNKGSLLPVKVIETFKQFAELELSSTEPILLDDQTKVVPRDFSVKFLQSNPHLLQIDEPFGYGGLKVIVKGTLDGEKVSLSYTTVSNESTGESTGIPAATGAELIAAGKINKRGVIAPETIDPALILHALGKRKPLNKNVKSTGMIIEKIYEDGAIETIKAGRDIT